MKSSCSFGKARSIAVFSLFVVLLASLVLLTAAERNFYKILGVERDATTREIRKAFKKLALTKHPDKHPGDASAHDVFVEINYAFEVLKDPDTRKKYDRYGEEGLKEDKDGSQYQGWNYYENDFGIYDDDEQIETLGQEFFDIVYNTNDVWFVNFYSPGCSHCHELAPAWRQFGETLAGIIGVGAVNCQDSWNICRQLGIRSYPTLMYFSTAGQHVFYRGRRDVEALKDFVLGKLTPVVKLPPTFNHFPRPTLLVICYVSVAECPDEEVLKMTKAIVVKHISVRLMDCSEDVEICRDRGFDSPHVRLLHPQQDPVVVYEDWDYDFSPAQVASNAFLALPPPQELNEVSWPERVVEMRSVGTPQLVFFSGSHCKDCDKWNKEMRLLGHIAGVETSYVNCDTFPSICAEARVPKAPSVRLFKAIGYEVYHFDINADRVSEWATEGIHSRLITLHDSDFPDRVMLSDEIWFVDFFAPWCPPCRAMLPHFREASKYLPEVNFGTVDCDEESDLCSRLNIQSYPTPILYLGSDGVPHHFDRDWNDANDFIMFFEDTLNPPVTELTTEALKDIMMSDEIWLVDFFAPWCGPCMAFMPAYREAARSLRKSGIKFGTINCDEHSFACNKHNLRSYPTVRLYKAPPQPGRSRSYSTFQGNRNADSVIAFAGNAMPQKVVKLSRKNYEDEVVWGDGDWVLMFGANWCRPCQFFKPIFNAVANMLDSTDLQFGSIDCAVSNDICRQYSIPHYPVVILLKKDTGEQLMSESNDILPLTEFLESNMEQTQDDNYPNHDEF